MVKIKKTELSSLIDHIKKSYNLFAPVEENNRSTFKLIDTAFEIDHSLKIYSVPVLRASFYLI